MTRQLAVNKFVWNDGDVQITFPKTTPEVPLKKINFIHATLEKAEGVEVRSSGWFAAMLRTNESVLLTSVHVRLVKTHRKHLTQLLTWVEVEYQVIGPKMGPLFSIGPDEALWALNSIRTESGDLVWSYRQEYFNKLWRNQE